MQKGRLLGPLALPRPCHRPLERPKSTGSSENLTCMGWLKNTSLDNRLGPLDPAWVVIW